MLSSSVIIFREVLEISMILSIVLAATHDLRGRWVWIGGGFVGGGVGAGLIALFAESISAMVSGVGQELFNAGILFTAALFIGWTVVWMKRHAREMSQHMRDVGQKVAEGKMPLYALSLIVGLAILREGSEIVLFVYGMILSGQSGASIVAGSALGLVTGAIAGLMLYYGLIKMSARHMLRVTGWLLILLVAGLMSQAVGFLSAAGYFSDFSNVMWDTSWLLSENSLGGKALHGLVGYSAHPTAIQIAFYLTTILALFSIINMDNKKKVAVAPIAAAFVIVSTIAPSYAG
jgi:high-affinity iron transporter